MIQSEFILLTLGVVDFVPLLPVIEIFVTVLLMLTG